MLHISANDNRRLIMNKVRDGRLRKIVAGVYTDDMEADLRDVAMDPEFLPHVVSSVIAGTNARVSHSTGLDWPCLANDVVDIYLLSPTVQRTIEMKNIGIRIIIRRDRNLSKKSKLLIKGNHGLVSRPITEQAILENLSVRKSDAGRINPQKAQEALWILVEKRQAAEGDAARYYPEYLTWIAKQTGLTREADVANDVINLWALSGRIEAVPRHDWALVDALRNAANILNARFSENRVEKTSNFSGPKTMRGHKNLHLLESYFSNYIEGTRLDLVDAINAMEKQTRMDIPAHKDEHDVVSGFLLIQSDSETPSNIEGETKDYISTLKNWHKQLFSHRALEIKTGEFKQRQNRVGSTYFTPPDMVFETLAIAHQIVSSVKSSFARAVLEKLAFISVHPFEDGNGRVSRMIMNNIRSAGGLPRLVFPNVLRDDYMSTLPAWSNNRDIEPFLGFMIKLEDVNAQIPWDKPLQEVIDFLENKSAFAESNEGKWGLGDDQTNDLQESPIIGLAKSKPKP